MIRYNNLKESEYYDFSNEKEIIIKEIKNIKSTHLRDKSSYELYEYWLGYIDILKKHLKKELRVPELERIIKTKAIEDSFEDGQSSGARFILDIKGIK